MGLFSNFGDIVDKYKKKDTDTTPVTDTSGSKSGLTGAKDIIGGTTGNPYEGMGTTGKIPDNIEKPKDLKFSDISKMMKPDTEQTIIQPDGKVDTPDLITISPINIDPITPVDDTTSTDLLKDIAKGGVDPKDPTINAVFDRLGAMSESARLAEAARLSASPTMTEGAKRAAKAGLERDISSARAKAAGDVAVAQKAQQFEATKALSQAEQFQQKLDFQKEQAEKDGSEFTEFESFIVTKLDSGVINVADYIGDNALRERARTILGDSATEGEIDAYITNSFRAYVNRNRDRMNLSVGTTLNDYVDTGRTLEDAQGDDTLRRNIALLYGVTDLTDPVIDEIIQSKWDIAGVTGIESMVSTMITNQLFPSEFTDDPTFKDNMVTWAQRAFLSGDLTQTPDGTLTLSQQALDNGVQWPWDNPTTMFDYVDPNGNDLDPGQQVDPTIEMDISGNGTDYFVTNPDGTKSAVTQGDVMDVWNTIANTMEAEEYLTTDGSGRTIIDVQKLLSSKFSDADTSVIYDQKLYNNTIKFDAEAGEYYDTDLDNNLVLTVTDALGDEHIIQHGTGEDRDLWAAVSEAAGRPLGIEEYVGIVTADDFIYSPEKGVQDSSVLDEGLQKPTTSEGWGIYDLDIDWATGGGHQSFGVVYNKNMFNTQNTKNLDSLFHNVGKNETKYVDMFTPNEATETWITNNTGKDVVVGGKTYTITGNYISTIVGEAKGKRGRRVIIRARVPRAIDKDTGETISLFDDFSVGTDSQENKGARTDAEGNIFFD